MKKQRRRAAKERLSAGRGVNEKRACTVPEFFYDLFLKKQRLS